MTAHRAVRCAATPNWKPCVAVEAPPRFARPEPALCAALAALDSRPLRYGALYSVALAVLAVRSPHPTLHSRRQSCKGDGFGRHLGVVVMIETTEALAEIDAICAVPGLDCVVIGGAT